jgi:gluconate kinase
LNEYLVSKSNHSGKDSLLEPQLLNLKYAPSTLFFYGVAGSGKSYVANLVGDLAGWYVYEADDDISSAMKLALAEHRPFTDEMRDEFFSRISLKIIQLQKKHPKLAVSQAVYKKKHRDYLQSKMPAMGMVCVTASDQCIFDRIKGRNKGISHASAKALRADFESPSADATIIVNENSQREIISQLNAYYSA